VKVGGEGVSPKGVPASLPTFFTIDTEDAGIGDLKVEVSGPNARHPKVTTDVVDDGNGKFRANYLPEDIGNYTVLSCF